MAHELKHTAGTLSRSEQPTERRLENPGASEDLAASCAFWDEKARENPYWCIPSFGPYDDRDLDKFWLSAAKISEDLKRALEYQQQPSDVVAEISCGIGRLTRAIASEVSHVYALDISPEMLLETSRRYRRVTLPVLCHRNHVLELL